MQAANRGSRPTTVRRFAACIASKAATPVPVPMSRIVPESGRSRHATRSLAGGVKMPGTASRSWTEAAESYDCHGYAMQVFGAFIIGLNQHRQECLCHHKAITMNTVHSILLRDLAARLGSELRGNPDIEITGVAGMEQAGPTELTFLANAKYAPKVKQSRAGAILVSEPLPQPTPASLTSANPYHDFARALALFYQPPRPKPGTHPQASIAATARIGGGASIGACAVF